MKKIEHKIIFIYLLVILYVSLVSILFINDITNKYTMIINPLFWLSVFIITIFFTKDGNDRFKGKTDKIQTVLIVGLIYLIFYFISGLFFGYSKSPYSHAITSVIKNIWAFLSIIVFQEYIKSALANNSAKSKLLYVIITIIFILIDINFYKFESNFVSGEVAFKYVSSTLFPIIIKNVLFTYLVIVGGYKTSLALRLPLAFANIMVPIFPDLNWFVSSLYETVLVFVVFITINYVHTSKAERVSKRNIRKQNPIKKIPFILSLFIFVGFVAGFFKYMPVAVMSNSMANLIKRGDVVVVEKLSDKEKTNIKLYDIVEYELDNHIVVHRVIKIEQSKDGKYKFTTKGDYNSAPDNKKVSEEQIIGKVKFKVPKIGYLAVLLNDFFEKTKPNVEMG